MWLDQGRSQQCGMQFSRIDLVAEAGAFVPLVKEFEHIPRSSSILIQVVSITENALINGVEIYSGTIVGDGALAPPACRSEQITLLLPMT